MCTGSSAIRSWRVGALCTYQKCGHCRDGIHRLYAHTLGLTCLTPMAAINIVVAPSHWITDINMRVDTATQDER